MGGYDLGLEEDFHCMSLRTFQLLNDMSETNLVYNKEMLEIILVIRNPQQQIARKYKF